MNPFFSRLNKTVNQFLIMLFIFILCFVMFLFLSFTLGCASGQSNTSHLNIDQKTFRHDLTVEVNGEKFIGVGVVKKAISYQVTVFPDDKIERIIYTTCHEEQVIDKPKTDGWFKKSITFTLISVPNISDVMACSLEIVVLDQDSRRNAFATIEFLDQRPEVILPVTLKCNGTIKRYESGVSICQGATGLIQQIIFSEPVIQTGSTPECDVMKSLNDRNFTFILPKGNCTFYFGAQRKINGKRVLHRLQTIGWTDIPYTK